MSALEAAEAAEFLGFANRLADAAARVTLKLFRTGAEVDDKAAGRNGFDPVTEADREAETVIRAMIEENYPDHGIRGEEQAEKSGGSGFVWYIDPIDGTRSYIIGVPLWGTLIGLERAGKPLIGLLDQPHIGERFIGSPDGAALIGRNGRSALSTSKCTRLGEAHLGTTSPRLFGPGIETKRFGAVESRVRMSRYGGDCYFYAMLAAGHVDLVIEAGLRPHDIVALIPIIEAAGGVVTGWDGSDARHGGRILAAATAELHAEAMALLAGRPRVG